MASGTQSTGYLPIAVGYVQGKFQGECWSDANAKLYTDDKCQTWSGSTGAVKYGVNYCKLKTDGGDSDPCPEPGN